VSSPGCVFALEDDELDDVTLVLSETPTEVSSEVAATGTLFPLNWTEGLTVMKFISSEFIKFQGRVCREGCRTVNSMRCFAPPSGKGRCTWS
jgi:hypothetical protein